MIVRMRRFFGVKTILIFIVIVAVFLRFYRLGDIPPSLTWDEVAWGYNAYSLGIDGKDEFGRFLPLDYLESFGDFKPPVYAYLSILPVKTFGLNEFAVRFPSALFGVLTVLVTYFLVLRLFSSSRNPPPRSPFSHLGGAHSGHPRGESRGELVALLACFFLAISPWHINLSRAAFEANVATFFIVLGVFFFLRAVIGTSLGAASYSPLGWNYIRTLVLLFSVVSFILSMYTFNTARVVAPLLIAILGIGFWKRLWEMKKEVVIVLIVGTIFMLPLLNFLMFPQASLRFREVNIFSDIGIIERTNQQIENDNNAWWSRIIHNRRFAYATEYLKHYFDHFKPSFLFIKGDGNPKFSTQDVGSLYLWELPFFVLGILFIFRQRIGYWWIVPLWMFIAIIPAATARETPHALRIAASLPTFQVFVAYGFIILLREISNIKNQISKIQIKYLIFALIFLFLIFNFSYYLHGYYVHYSREYSGEWQYGYKEAIAFVQKQEKNFDEIKFTTDLGRPYIYYLFYTKIDPDVFRKNSVVKREAVGFVNVERVAKYSFLKDLKAGEDEGRNILYVDLNKRVPENATILKTFYLLNDKPVLTAYTL